LGLVVWKCGGEVVCVCAGCAVVVLGPIYQEVIMLCVWWGCRCQGRWLYIGVLVGLEDEVFVGGGFVRICVVILLWWGVPV
jgi:hypothetical protein